MANTYSLEVKNMLNDTNACLNCGKSLKYLNNKNKGYCCYDCFLKKPPRFAYLESLYNCDIIEYILNELKRTNSMYVVSELLGINRKSITDFLARNGIVRKVIWVKEKECC